MVNELLLAFLPVFWIHSQETELPVAVDAHGDVSSKGLTSPVYVAMRDRPSHYELLAVALFEYQPPMMVLGCIPVGAHAGDIEHVTVRIGKDNRGRPTHVQSVFYSAHTRAEGVWVGAKHLEFHGKRPVVYVAKDNHAMYWAPGAYSRFGVFGNDFCDRGSLWTPSSTSCFPLQPWMSIPFQNHVAPLTDREWFWTGERYVPNPNLRSHLFNKCTRLFTPLERLFCALLVLILGLYFLMWFRATTIVAEHME